MNNANTPVHIDCGTPVSFDPTIRSWGDPDDPDHGTKYYYAVCEHCDVDLFKFETEEG